MSITKFNVFDKTMTAGVAIADKYPVAYNTSSYNQAAAASANSLNFAGVAVGSSLSDEALSDGTYGDVLVRNKGIGQGYASEAFDTIGQGVCVASSSEFGPIKTNATPLTYVKVGICRGCPESGTVPTLEGDVFEIEFCDPVEVSS